MYEIKKIQQQMGGWPVSAGRGEMWYFYDEEKAYLHADAGRRFGRHENGWEEE